MAADASLIAWIDELVALFNRQSLDLPHGVFDRRTQFLLNGTPFDHMLGRPPGDPLVLMIARGPAGYRFAMKALQHALPDARVDCGEVEQGQDAGDDAWIVPLWLSGHLRGTGDGVEAVMRVLVVRDERGVVTRADLALDAGIVERLREARLRE
ncbi:MAG: hypothetical protein OEW19_00935 [Acidobacteriota bacterium]|nr:hypothetical protein [Acidobacteriota bacterium]